MIFKQILTAYERILLDAIVNNYQKVPGYIPNEELLPESGLNPRSFPGVLGSLQREGYIYCFGSTLGDDIEITCDAKDLLLLKTKKGDRGCNHEECSCHTTEEVQPT